MMASGMRSCGCEIVFLLSNSSCFEGIPGPKKGHGFGWQRIALGYVSPLGLRCLSKLFRRNVLRVSRTMAGSSLIRVVERERAHGVCELLKEGFLYGNGCAKN